MTPITHSFFHGSQKIILETGCVAKQADASVMIQSGDTVVLVTVTLGKEPSMRPKFVPLSVHYQEKTYAAGRIPGSFFRREGRPGEGEILASRLIDRSVRPLIDKNFYREIQVVATVLSVDPEIHPDILAILGASAALHLSSVPFQGPLAASRLGFLDEKWIINPATSEREKSSVDLVLSSNNDGIVMVEASAKEYPELEMFAAIQSTCAFQRMVIKELNTFGEKCENAGLKKNKIEDAIITFEDAHSIFNENLKEIQKYFDRWILLICKDEKAKLSKEFQATLKEKVSLFYKNKQIDDKKTLNETIEEVLHLLKNFKSKEIRQHIFKEKRRVDGRSLEAVRSLDVRVGILPKTHGSCLFTRGGTQSLATATLGSEKDAQQVDDLVGNRSDHFLLHYNFPPFSVGEVGIVGSPKRREIGHGALAKRALSAVLPSIEEFPYTLRVVSEILESDGSSSMATVCAGSLALMDAGVPIKKSVAGVAMGLVIHSKEEWVVLSDINALEDHLGDMDFKVAGTSDGITALQMDVKVPGISGEMLQIALLQAKAARLHILKTMDQALSKPSDSLSKSVPKCYRMQIPVHKIKDLVGKGGVTIKRLSNEFSAVIDISDSGLVKMSLPSEQNAILLQEKITQLVGDLDVNGIYTGKVVRIESFGAFVELNGSGKNGLIHISELTDSRVAKVSDCLELGQNVRVRVAAVDSKSGRIRLSMKNISEIELVEKSLIENKEIMDDSLKSTSASDGESIHGSDEDF